MAAALHRHQFGSGPRCRQVAAVGDRDDRVVFAVDDQDGPGDSAPVLSKARSGAVQYGLDEHLGAGVAGPSHDVVLSPGRVWFGEHLAREPRHEVAVVLAPVDGVVLVPPLPVGWGVDELPEAQTRRAVDDGGWRDEHEPLDASSLLGRDLDGPAPTGGEPEEADAA